MSSTVSGKCDDGSSCVPDDFRSEIVHFLNRESQRVADSLSRYRNELLSQLNPDGTLWPCVGWPVRDASEDPSETEVHGAKGALGFSPFYYYPFLFSAAFPDLSLEFLRSLASANRILLEALLTADNRIDIDRSMDPMDLFLMDAYFQKALEILVPFLPPESPFWKECENLCLDYGRAVLKEVLFHRYRLEPYSLEEFKAISIGKAGLIKTTVLALCTMSGCSALRDSMLASQEAFLAGFQAFDDLKDWREDYARQNYTYLLTAVLEEAGLVREIECGAWPDPEEVGRRLYHSGRAEMQLLMSEDLFRRSLEFVEDLPLPLWKEMVRGFLKNSRAMREDLKEIRQRDLFRSSQASSMAVPGGDEERSVAEKLREGLVRGRHFLSVSQEAHGAYRLVSSPYGYMNPSTPLGHSQAATELVRRTLGFLKAVQPEVAWLVEKASEWLRGAHDSLNTHLPAGLEQAFRVRTKKEIEALEVRLASAPPRDRQTLVAPDRGFWAEVLYQAALEGLSPPCLENHALRTVQTGEDPAWGCAVQEEGKSYGMVRPLLVLYTFCQALALRQGGLPRAVREALQARLLSGYQKNRTWGNYTDTAMALTGLLITEYMGPELRHAAQKLLLGQEPDGSWPPNALYSKDECCYGSRELTTAWCAEALFLYSERSRSVFSRPDAMPAASGKEVQPAIVLHAGIPAQMLPDLQILLERCRSILPGPEQVQVYVGRWEAMPGHFLMAKDGQTSVAIHMAGTGLSALSADQRPIAVELALAWVEVVRLQTRGPVRTRLEHLFVEGLGFLLCRKLWPGATPWEQAGMTRLDWQWCHENEWYLRELVRQSVRQEEPGKDSQAVTWPDPSFVLPAPAPRHANLYMGLRLFDQEMKTGVSEVRFHDFISWGLPEVRLQVQNLWGQSSRRLSQAF